MTTRQIIDALLAVVEAARRELACRCGPEWTQYPHRPHAPDCAEFLCPDTMAALEAAEEVLRETRHGKELD